MQENGLIMQIKKKPHKYCRPQKIGNKYSLDINCQNPPTPLSPAESYGRHSNCVVSQLISCLNLLYFRNETFLLARQFYTG